jgi:hypothetical protein
MRCKSRSLRHVGNTTLAGQRCTRGNEWLVCTPAGEALNADKVSAYEACPAGDVGGAVVSLLLMLHFDLLISS